MSNLKANQCRIENNEACNVQKFYKMPIVGAQTELKLLKILIIMNNYF